MTPALPQVWDSRVEIEWGKRRVGAVSRDGLRATKRLADSRICSISPGSATRSTMADKKLVFSLADEPEGSDRTWRDVDMSPEAVDARIRLW